MFFSWGRPLAKLLILPGTDVSESRAYKGWTGRSASVPAIRKLAPPYNARGRPRGRLSGPRIGPRGLRRSRPAGGHSAEGCARAAAAGAGQDRRHQRRLAGGELARRLGEGVAGARLRAELPVRAPFGDVEIDLQDAPLRQHQVDPHRQRKFQRLAHVAAALPEEEVLGDLLRDGRAAAHLGDVVGFVERLAHPPPIDPVMGAEAAVLGRDDRARQRRRDPVEGHHGALHALASDPAPQHHRRNRVDEPIERRDQIGHEHQDQHDDREEPQHAKYAPART